MVSLRPLLFANLLVFLLFVTAVFAAYGKAGPDERPPTAAGVTASAQPYDNQLAMLTDNSEAAASGRIIRDAMQDLPAPKIDRIEIAPALMAQLLNDKTIESRSALQEQRAAASTGTLVIRFNLNDDSATIDDGSYGATAVTRTLPPGRYQIAVTKAGYEELSTAPQISAGETTVVSALLNEPPGVEYVDGVWRNGVRSGEGSYSGKDGSRYVGHFEGGKFDGQGTLTTATKGIYSGSWSGSRLNGHGSYISKSGDLYVGNFVNGEFHGAGTMTYADGSHYEGHFASGEYNGKGTLTFASGKRYVGQFLDGEFHGLGEFMNPNGSRISGSFKFGEHFGQATLTTAQGEVYTARTTEPGICYREKSYRATTCPQLEEW